MIRWTIYLVQKVPNSLNYILFHNSMQALVFTSLINEENVSSREKESLKAALPFLRVSHSHYTRYTEFSGV